MQEPRAVAGRLPVMDHGRFRELEKFRPETDMPLDTAISGYVLVLRSGGIETFESCQGGPGHAFPDPTVKFHGNSWEGFKALSIAMTYRLPVLSVRMVWDVCDGLPHGPWWEMTFHTTDQTLGQPERRLQCSHLGRPPVP